MTFDFPGMIKHVTVIHGVRFPAGAHRSGTTYLTMKDGVLRYENRFVWQFVTDGELVLIWEHSKGPA